MTTANAEAYIGSVAMRDHQKTRREELRKHLTDLIRTENKTKGKHSMQWDDIIDYIIKH